MYHPISFEQFRAAMEKIGAYQVDVPGTAEAVFERPIVTKSGQTFPEVIRIYSSITRSGRSRDVGKDAIRVCLFRDDRIAISTKRVNRSAQPDVVLSRVVDRARAAFAYAINPENRGPSGYLFTKGRKIE